jgi:proteasome lid subunit RPN8/RPN11
MIHLDHEFALLFSRKDGTPIGQVPVTVDWDPACESARFAAVRRGLLVATAPVPTTVSPLWSRRLGEPYMRGFRVHVEVPGPTAWACDFPLACFSGPARSLASGMVETGHLVDGERFRYVPLAFPRDGSRPEAESGGFATEEQIPPLPMRDTALASVLAGAHPVGPADPEDMPALLPASVLEEVTELTRGAGERETGGVLIGHLHRDSTVPEIAVEVTAQIPARHAEASSSRLRFTSETWSDVARALALRRGGEVWLGWWHSHPVRAWCRDCPPEKRHDCALPRGFFSEHDRLLHRTVFPRAYSLGLVVSDTESGLRYSLFGWRRGLVEPRGFHLAGARDLTGTCEGATPTDGEGRDACDLETAR